MPELWYSAAVRDPGPTAKVWPQLNTMSGVILHSMEGYWTAARAMLMGAPEVSWHYSILRDGSVYQHYPLNHSPWHAGGQTQNTRLIGIEHEGVAGQALTSPQLAASVTLTRWIAQQGGWALQRATGISQTLYEHREVNATTQCPSGRIPWARYTEEDTMVPTKVLGSAAEIDAIKTIFAAAGQQDGEYIASDTGPVILTVDVPVGFTAIVGLVKA